MERNDKTIELFLFVMSNILRELKKFDKNGTYSSKRKISLKSIENPLSKKSSYDSILVQQIIAYVRKGVATFAYVEL